MPMALLEAHAAMLPRLYAEDQVRVMNAVAYGFGAMKDDDAAQFRKRLQEALGDEEKPRTFKSPDQAFAGMGIPIARKVKSDASP